MATQISFDDQAKQSLARGSAILEKAVATTLGPRGQNVAIDRGYEVMVVHDGVTVARAVNPKDPYENMGVRIVREAANKTVESVGDGTSVTVVLANAIIQECLKLTATGINPMSLRRGLEEGQNLLLSELDRIARPIKTLEEKIQIATISAEDAELGRMIATLIHKVGRDGVITVEESKGTDTYTEHQEGMQFENGFISPYFITNPLRNEATIENPYILLCDRNIVNVSELIPLMESMLKAKQLNLVVIAPDITDSALGVLAGTKMQGGMNLLAVRAPYMGNKQKEFIGDIATLTGATVFTQDADMKIEEATFEMLGSAARITATKDATLIVAGKGKKSDIKDRIAAIRSALERAEGSDFEQEKLRERIAKLTSGVAIIKVGGATEVEMKERRERALDAIAATQAAVAEGIVPGGETIYLQIKNKVVHNNILYQALYKPFYKLLENAGLEAARYIDRLKPGEGVDVTEAKIVDMMKQGIIDPVMVPKEAIRNAISVAIQIITTNCLITEEPKKDGEKS